MQRLVLPSRSVFLLLLLLSSLSLLFSHTFASTAYPQKEYCYDKNIVSFYFAGNVTVANVEKFETPGVSFYIRTFSYRTLPSKTNYFYQGLLSTSANNMVINRIHKYAIFSESNNYLVQYDSETMSRPAITPVDINFYGTKTFTTNKLTFGIETKKTSGNGAIISMINLKQLSTTWKRPISFNQTISTCYAQVDYNNMLYNESEDVVYMMVHFNRSLIVGQSRNETVKLMRSGALRVVPTAVVFEGPTSADTKLVEIPNNQSTAVILVKYDTKSGNPTIIHTAFFNLAPNAPIHFLSMRENGQLAVMWMIDQMDDTLTLYNHITGKSDVKPVTGKTTYLMAFDKTAERNLIFWTADTYYSAAVQVSPQHWLTDGDRLIVVFGDTQYLEIRAYDLLSGGNSPPLADQRIEFSQPVYMNLKVDATYRYLYYQYCNMSGCSLVKYDTSTFQTVYEQRLINGLVNIQFILSADSQEGVITMVVSSYGPIKLAFDGPDSYPLAESKLSFSSYLIRLYENCSCQQQHCQVPTCYGIESLQDKVCSGNGVCQFGGKCTCLPFYQGDYCQFKTCFGIPEYNSSVCYGRGQCTDVNQCSCVKGRGDQCEKAICFNIPEDNPTVCSGRGICTSPNNCKCPDDYTGSTCNIKRVNFQYKCPPGQYYNGSTLTVSMTANGFPAEFLMKKDVIGKNYMLSYNSSAVYRLPISRQDDSTAQLIPFQHEFPFYALPIVIDYQDELMYLIYAYSVSEVRMAVYSYAKKRYIQYSNSTIHVDSAVGLCNLVTDKYIRVVISFSPITSGRLRMFGCPEVTLSASIRVVYLVELNSNDLTCSRLVLLDKGRHFDRCNIVENPTEGTLFISPSTKHMYLFMFVEAPNYYKTQYGQVFHVSEKYGSTINHAATTQLGDLVLVGTDSMEEIRTIVFMDTQGHAKNKNWNMTDGSWDINGLFVSPKTSYTYVYGQRKDSLFSFIAKYTLKGEQLWNVTTDGVKIVGLQDDKSTDNLVVIGVANATNTVRFKDNWYSLSRDNQFYYLKFTLTDGNCTNCPVGTIQTSDNVATYGNGIDSCRKCQPGYYQSEDFQKCIQCPAGTYSEDPVDGCIKCPSGTYSSNLGSTFCTRCLAGFTFGDGSTNTHCGVAIGFWVGFVVMIVIILVFIVLSICLVALRVQYAKAKENQRDAMELALLRSDQLSTSGSDDKLTFQLDPSLNEIKFEELTNFVEIGSGGSGCIVFKTEWKKITVAVKVYRVSLDNSNVEEFEHELKLQSSVHHQNIVQFYGYINQFPKIGIVLEYCAKGNLKQFIHQAIKEFAAKASTVGLQSASSLLLQSTNIVTDWNLKVRMLQDIARGMLFLHVKGIIHRDLKTENVLVDKNLNAKISDLGVSKFDQSNSSTMTKAVGTSFFMAPEVVRGENYTNKCDVFSFAVIIYEVLTCSTHHPYFYTLKKRKGLSPASASVTNYSDTDTLTSTSTNSSIPMMSSTYYSSTQTPPVTSTTTRRGTTKSESTMNIEFEVSRNPNFRPEFPDSYQLLPTGHHAFDIQKTLIDMMTKCWDDNPSERPSFEEILSTLESLTIEQ